MSVNLSPIGGAAAQFFDNNGNPLSGGKLYTYAAGTTTPLASYTTSAGNVPHTNPIILDSAGRVPGGQIWLTDGSVDYKFLLETSFSVLVGTFDNIPSTPNVSASDIAVVASTYNAGATVQAQLTNVGSNTGAANVGFTPAGAGAVATTVQGKMRESVSVLDFGADPTGVADSTAAFNLATQATAVHGGNDDLSMRRDIIAPPGDYKILGTVYVRKGQRLRGAGDGATRITMGPQTVSGRVIFKLGHGLIAGVVTQDPGGLPPIIESMHTFGGDANGPVIDMAVPGAQARDLFITSSGIGVAVGGGDTILTRCIIDQGLNGITVRGQNHIISNCLFYNINYGITVGSNCYDVQIGDCHFEYGKYNDIIFSDGASNIKNISIANCQFVKNEQYATSDAGINFRSNAAEVTIKGCDFRNQRTYSIARTNGVANIVRVSDCTFNGLKTNPAYAQSTTAAGIDTTNSVFSIVDCKFENLFGNPINVGSGFPYPVLVQGCTYGAISTAASFVAINGTAGSVVINGCVGDNVLPLVNTQSAIGLTLKGNINWLPIGNSGGRYFVTIPTRGAAIAAVGIRANTNPGGNPLYSKASSVYASRYVDSNGSNVTDYATKTTLYETPASFAPVIDVAVAFDSVGGGTAVLYAANGRNLVVSIPDTYTSVAFNVDYVTS